MAELRFRSIFLSDVHLGTPHCKAAYLLDFLRRTRSDFLYLVGDIVDLEALARRAWWHPLHGAILGELLHKAANGTRVIYLPGNHDAPLRGLAGGRLGGIEVRLHALHMAADGRRYRVSHGDEFDPERIGRSWLMLAGELGLRLLCTLNRGVNALRRGVALPYLPLTILTKTRIGRALAYIRRFEQRVLDAAQEHGVDGHICGHIHFGDIRRVDGRVYLNDGDWVEHCTALVEHGDGAMELLHWSERRASLARLAPQTRPTASLPATAAAALVLQR